jgi:hypothetical protein
MVIKGAWYRWKIKAEMLLPFMSSGIIPEARNNRWLIPGDEETPMPRKGEFIVFLSFLERGLSFPTSHFIRRFLEFYGIKITDLGPHSIQQISLFVALCQCSLGCPPYFPLWLAIFHGRITHESPNGPMVAAGGITFQV